MTSLLPLDDFRRIHGIPPFHFWGLLSTTLNPRGSPCDDIVRRYSWQASNAIGRSEIEEAIETAEKRLRDYLGYSIAPEYREETVPWPRYYDHSRTRLANWDAHGEFIGARLPWPSGYVQAVGVESRTLIGAASLANGKLVITDADSDGLSDTFTITIATSQTDADKIAVYFGSADRLDGEAVGERYRIRPVKVTITGGNAIVVGRYWLLVRPILYEGVATQPIDPATATNFASSLDVYTRTTDPDGQTVDNAQATLIWETEPCHGWFCCCDGCAGSISYVPVDSSFDPAAQGLAIARAGIRNSRMGELNIGGAVLNTTTSIWSAVSWAAGREPDRVQVRYLAGYPLEGGNVATRYQNIVARLAAAEMTHRICACDVANRSISYWSFDAARTAGNNDERFAISSQDLDNPLGTRRGHILAWKEIRNLRIAPGVIDH